MELWTKKYNEIEVGGRERGDENEEEERQRYRWGGRFQKVDFKIECDR